MNSTLHWTLDPWGWTLVHGRFVPSDPARKMAVAGTGGTIRVCKCCMRWLPCNSHHQPPRSSHLVALNLGSPLTCFRNLT